MGLRETLETIRSSNAASYSEFESERPRRPSPPIEAAPALGPPPWVTIWTRPRVAIIRLASEASPVWLPLLAIAAGAGQALGRAMITSVGQRFAPSEVVSVFSLIGAVGMLSVVYLGGTVIWAVAGLYGTKPRLSWVWAALAWGSLPNVAMAALMAPAIASYGSDLFAADAVPTPGPPGFFLALLALYLADLVLGLWAAVMTVNALAAVLRISAWRVILVALLSAPIIFAAVVMPVLLALQLARSGWFWLR